jgi:hypothetical protein
MAVVRTVALLVLAVCVSCCAAIPRAGLDEAPGPDEGPLTAVEDREITTEEFDSFERLRENPIDPREADLDALRSIPGFPERLAERVAEAISSAGRRGRWVDRLTPPEAEELCRYRDYLVLPRVAAISCTGVVTAEAGGSEDLAPREGRLALSALGSKVLWRGRTPLTMRQSSFYVSTKALSGAVRLHAGSFTPAFAMGLVFGGSASSSFFSTNYPFGPSRAIAGTTSRFGTAVYGGAIELWCRSAKGTLVVGRPRLVRSDGFELAPEPLRAARVSLRLSGGEIGLSGVEDASMPSNGVFAVDGGWSSGVVRAGVELGFAGSGSPGCLMGLSYRADKSRAGFLLHSVPPGMGGRFGRVNGRALGADHRQSGGTIVIEHGVARGVRVRTAVERYGRSEALEDETRDVVKAECEREWRRVLIRCSWSSSSERREKVVPFPSENTPTVDKTGSLALVSSFKAKRGLILKLSVRSPERRGIVGVLYSPSMSVTSFSNRFEASLTGALYRVPGDGPVCYYYEPSLSGVYPWRVASGRTVRLSCIISFNYNKLEFSYHVAFEEGRPWDGMVQGVFKF